MHIAVEKFTVWAIAVICVAGQAPAQQPKVDFGRDVLPIFRQNCMSCHGPDQAISGLRLDRKSSVFKDGTRRVVAGSSQNSFLYHRLAGTEYGMQMPPTGALRPEQVATIKSWIDQGAEWPDSLSNEINRPPFNPKAESAVEILRKGDTSGFIKALAQDPQLVNARGPEGSTPFMYAALYGDASVLARLLKKGANPNLKNDAGATALMWAIVGGDKAGEEKVRVLLAKGAEVNAISDDLRTPLMIAAGLPTGMPIIKLLLEHGAELNPTTHPDADSSPLAQATLAANPEMMQLLIDRGADVQASAGTALPLALEQNCRRCFDLLMKQKLAPKVYTETLLQVANFADADAIRALIDHGAKVDEPDPLGHTALAYAAGSDVPAAEVVKLLLDRGANANSKSPHKNSGDTGMSVIDLALLRGETPVANLLLKSGATVAVPAPTSPKPQPADSGRSAIERSLPLIQSADAGFTAKSGCISCHNDSLASMAVGFARAHGFKVDDAMSRQQVRTTVAKLSHSRDLLHQGFAGGGAQSDTFFPQILGYMLLGLQAEGYEADLNTDTVAIYLKSRQMPDGSWPYPEADTRPPLCSDHIGQTALAMRALQLYAPKGHKAEFEAAVVLAANWIAREEAITTEDHIWKLLGLAWAGRDNAAAGKARTELLALQRPDGGWADLPTMSSNAWSTARAMFALQFAGATGADAAVKRGAEYLLNNQLADGSWYVRTRALGFQPYFETGFPHGVNQSISAAATSYATMALIQASPAPGQR